MNLSYIIEKKIPVKTTPIGLINLRNLCRNYLESMSFRDFLTGSQVKDLCSTQALYKRICRSMINYVPDQASKKISFSLTLHELVLLIDLKDIGNVDVETYNMLMELEGKIDPRIKLYQKTTK